MRRRLLSLLSCALAVLTSRSGADPLDRTSAEPQLDQFGIAMLNPSLDPQVDWTADWEASRAFTKANQVDPYDERVATKGTGTFTIGGGELIFDGDTPRLYIAAEAPVDGDDDDEPAWLNTEFTAYARLEAWGSSSAGFTLISRTNHDTSDVAPCDAHGYYARVVFSSGLVYIKKEFRHSNADGVVYSRAVYSSDGKSRTSAIDFDYVNRFIGIKSIVRDRPDGRSVHLQVYLDLTEGVDGGDWQLAVEYDDFDLEATAPTGCRYSYTPAGVLDDQCPVLRPGRRSILRSDMVNGLHWKWASVREIAPLPSPP